MIRGLQICQENNYTYAEVEIDLKTLLTYIVREVHMKIQIVRRLITMETLLSNKLIQSQRVESLKRSQYFKLNTLLIKLKGLISLDQKEFSYVRKCNMKQGDDMYLKQSLYLYQKKNNNRYIRQGAPRVCYMHFINIK